MPDLLWRPKEDEEEDPLLTEVITGVQMVGGDCYYICLVFFIVMVVLCNKWCEIF